MTPLVKRILTAAGLDGVKMIAEVLGVSPEQLADAVAPPTGGVLLAGLRNYRRAPRLTQIELAHRAGLQPGTICRLEKQRQAAGQPAAEAIASVLHVSPEQLTSDRKDVQVARETKRTMTPFGERQCTDCRLVKPISAYVPIRATKTGHYGRCRECRAQRARERYQTDPVEREAQLARAHRNRLKRLKRARPVEDP